MHTKCTQSGIDNGQLWTLEKLGHLKHFAVSDHCFDRLADSYVWSHFISFNVKEELSSESITP